MWFWPSYIWERGDKDQLYNSWDIIFNIWHRSGDNITLLCNGGEWMSILNNNEGIMNINDWVYKWDEAIFGN